MNWTYSPRSLSQYRCPAGVRAGLAALLLPLGLMVSACSESEPEIEGAEFIATDIRMSPNAKIEWIDHDRFLTIGSVQADHPDSNISLLLVDSETGQWKSFGPAAGELCHANGYVRYTRRVPYEQNENGWVRFSGSLSDLLEQGSLPLNEESVPEPNVFNVFTCKREPKPEGFEDQLVLPLRPGYGFISGVSQLNPEGFDNNENLAYFASPDSEPVQLPFGRYDIDRTYELNSRTRFLEFSDEYLLVDGGDQIGRYSTADYGCEQMFWRGGDPSSLEGICLPSSSWGRLNFSDIDALSNGAYLVKSNALGASSIGKAGLYRFRPDRPMQAERLLPAMIEEVEVSPDGCRAALAYSTTIKPPFMLGIVNFCTHRK